MPSRTFPSDGPSRQLSDYLDRLSDDLTVLSGFIQLAQIAHQRDRFSPDDLKMAWQRVPQAAQRLQEMTALTLDAR